MNSSVFKQVVLKKMKLMSFHHVSKNVLDSMIFELSEHAAFDIGDHLLARLTCDAPGEELVNLELRSPKTWWDAFKERFHLRWLKPPEYITKRIDVSVIYPKLSLPDESYRFIVEREEI